MSNFTLPVPIVIDKDGDLTLRLYKVVDKNESYKNESYKNESFLSANRRDNVIGRIVATLKVSRKVLVDNSEPFKAEFTGKSWEEARQGTVDMEADTVPSIEVCLRALHNSITEEMYAVPVEEVWEVIQYCEYRQIDALKPKDWFGKWLEVRDIEKTMIEDSAEMRKLLFPCYVFDHPEGFAFLTKSLAYRLPDHITESNPTVYRSLHLDGNVIGSINGARGSLRSKLLRDLFCPVGDFLVQTCDCKEKSLFNYNLALSKTGIWPLHTYHKKSVQQVLDSLGFVNFKCNIPEGACVKCRPKLRGSAVEESRLNLLNYFHGLCLDCMKMTKTGDIDQDYWEHDIRKIWDRGCRIRHGQPTWYFSFMGRKPDIQKHYQQKKTHYEARRDVFG